MLMVSLALVIGGAIGLLGGGGSLLTVPVFTYVLGYDARQAVAMSLPVVGMAAVAGAVRAWVSGALRAGPGAVTGLSAMAGAFAGAWLARFFSGRAQLTLLALIMIGAAVAMVMRTRAEGRAPHRPHAAPLAAAGFGVGLLTGLVGVSGGFLIVPALVVAGGLPMREAVGTSLFVMALSAAAGFAGYAGRVSIVWSTVLLFGAVAAAGTLAGGAIGARMPEAPLQAVFAAVLVVLAGFMLLRG